MKVIKEVKLQDFQYNINNYILVTKSFLNKINIIDNDRCFFCDQKTGTIPQLFIHFNDVQNFWSSLKNMVSNTNKSHTSAKF